MTMVVVVNDLADIWAVLGSLEKKEVKARRVDMQ